MVYNKKKSAKRILIIGSICVVAIVIGILLKWHSELLILIGGLGIYILIELCFWVIMLLFSDPFNYKKLPEPNQIKEQKYDNKSFPYL